MSAAISPRVCVVGGGAAGYFAAIQCAAILKKGGVRASVYILEMNKEPLYKVGISGGGRCNVMHDPTKLVRDIVAGYPRGERELIGPYSKLFGPEDAHAWFSQRFAMKTEEDGRVFPVTDSSATVINALVAAGEDAGVKCLCQVNVRDLQVPTPSTDRFRLLCSSRHPAQRGSLSEHLADRVIFASGSARTGYDLLQTLGHSISEPLPSLFSLRIADPHLTSLAGTSLASVRVRLLLEKAFVSQHADLVKKNLMGSLAQTGAVLVTHHGLSGPAVLRLSAFAARILAAMNYTADVEVHWLPGLSVGEVSSRLEACKTLLPQRPVLAAPPADLSPVTKRLWNFLVTRSGSLERGETTTWASLSKNNIRKLASEICACRLPVTGRAVNKDEFVTAGGVLLREVDMDSMESKKVPGLFFAGEVLNMDGITGGYNFQAAWTSGYIAGTACARSIINEIPSKS